MSLYDDDQGVRSQCGTSCKMLICKLHVRPKSVNVVQQLHDDGIEERVSLLRKTRRTSPIEYSRWLDYVHAAQHFSVNSAILAYHNAHSMKDADY
jgi:hypothetical protein